MPRSLAYATSQRMSESSERTGISKRDAHRQTRIIIDRVREPGASGRVSKGVSHSGHGSPVMRSRMS